MNADDRTLIPGHEPTLLMPAPGGQATVVMKRPAVPRSVSPAAGVELQRLVAGINPVLGAAGPLLRLVGQLRTTPAPDDPPGLRLQLRAWGGQLRATPAAHARPR